MLHFLNWRNASQLICTEIVLLKSIFHAKKSDDFFKKIFNEEYQFRRPLNDTVAYLRNFISNCRHRIREWQQNLAVFRISWWTCRVRWWIFTNFALYCDEYEQTIQTIQVRKYFVIHTYHFYMNTNKQEKNPSPVLMGNLSRFLLSMYRGISQ